MNVKFVALVILIFVLTTGCQDSASETSTQTPVSTIPTHTVFPTLTFTPVPTSTSQPLIHQPELISKGKLNCSLLGKLAKCIDDVLDIEFEYPTIWGEIEAELRTGGYSGYAYTYYFGGKTIAETEPLVAGGRSINFSEGRGGMSTDFAGYGDAGMQTRESCDPNLQVLFPICQKLSQNVAWMIRLPNAEYICNSAPGFYTTPIFRIEIDLPDNLKINGFVFEAPFYSEKFFNDVKTELYPLLGLGSDMIPTRCNEKEQQAFDSKLQVFLDKLTDKSADSETLKNLDELTHLANSIVFK